ncbi:MAG: Clp protease N-terminal domain-containing protein [Planctomycetaceae bacterium]
MNRELNPSTRAALQTARDNARDHGSEQVEPEHLLLALLDDPQAAAGLSEEVRSRLRTELSSRLPMQAEIVARGKLPLSPYSERILEYADEAATERQSDAIEPLHLLIGLFQEERGVVGEMLRDCGFDADQLRRSLRGPATTNRLENITAESQHPENADTPVNGSSRGLVESLFEESAPLPAPGDEFDSRLYVASQEGWRAKIKRGWDKAYCYSKAPGEDGFHLLLAGEIYVQRDDEKFCLNCARRHGILTADRLHWQFQARQ